MLKIVKNERAMLELGGTPKSMTGSACGGWCATAKFRRGGLPVVRRRRKCRGLGSTTGGSMSTGSGAVHEPDPAGVPAPLAEVAEVLLVRHLPGLSTRDLRPALGEDAVGLSATSIGRLTAVCVEE